MHKSPLGVAIIGAIVAGLISILPYAYDFFIRNRVSVTYKIVKSDVINAGSENQIIIIDVENSGRVVIEEINSQILFPNSKAEKSSVDSPAGVPVKVTVETGSYNVNVSELNPGEKFRISLLISGDLSRNATKFNIRAKNVPVSSIAERVDSADIYSSRFDIYLVGGAISSFAFSILYFLVKKKNENKYDDVHEFQFDRDVVINVLANSYGVSEYFKSRLIGEPNYIKFIDIIVIGIREKIIPRDRGIPCLVSLLDIKMSSKSRAQLAESLKMLLGDVATDTFLAEERGNWLEKRKAIIELTEPRKSLASAVTASETQK